jgi:hypothetical protein
LHNLGDFLPKKPGEVEQKVMKQMFEASVDGQPYDPDKWSQYFRPAGMAQKTGDPVATAPQPAPAVQALHKGEVDGKPVLETTPAPTSSGNENKAEEILAMIRSRQQK